jgi:hypothetical protein
MVRESRAQLSDGVKLGVGIRIFPRPSKAKKNSNGYFIPTVVKLWKQMVCFVWTLESHKSRHLQSKCHLVMVAQSRTFDAAPESIEVHSTDAHQE